MKQKKIIFILMLGIFFILICLNKEVFAINKEDVSLRIESDPPVTTEVKKGDIITYKIIIENKTTEHVIKYPTLRIYNISEDLEYVNIATNNIWDIENYTDAITVTLDEKIESNSSQIIEIKFKVKGNKSEIKFPDVIYLIWDEKFLTIEEANEFIGNLNYSDDTTFEEDQVLLGTNAVISTLESQEKHTVFSNFTETIKGISASLTTEPNATIKVKENDTITYKFTLKNDSEYTCLFPYIRIIIPEGTEFVDIHSNNEEVSSDGFNSEQLYYSCIISELSKKSEIWLELTVKVTGSKEKIDFPYIIYTIVNSEFTIYDFMERLYSIDFMISETIEEMQIALGNVAYINEISSNEAHFVTSEAKPEPRPEPAPNPQPTPEPKPTPSPAPNPSTISSNKYKISDNFISGVDINTTVTEMINNITSSTGSNIKIYKENKEITGDEKLSTSMVLKVNDNSNYTIIVNGDINEDGKLSITDISLLKLHMVKINELSGNREKAADYNNDANISVTDLSKIKRTLVGL